MMTASKPIILFVPGAWHSAQAFLGCSKLLEQAGYKTELIDLPSVGAAKPLTDFKNDVDMIRTYIRMASEAGEEVMLVAHSYGSIPACEAVKGLDVQSRHKAGKPGGVIHIYFLAAFIVDEGQTVLEVLGGEPPPWFIVSDDQMEVTPQDPEDVLYNDLDMDLQDKCIERLRPFSYQCMRKPMTYAAWKDVPSTYFFCGLDKALSPWIQEQMVQITAKGCPMKTDYAEAGHCPFLGKPRETVAAILKATGEFDESQDSKAMLAQFLETGTFEARLPAGRMRYDYSA